MNRHTELDPRRFEGQVDGEPVRLYRLWNRHGMEVAICNLGAKILQVLVPDAQGHLSDVCLGYDSLARLQAGAASMGAFIGRYAGRIAQARFTLDGVTHQLSANQGPHCLHGGPRGSRNRVFSARQDDPHTLQLDLRFTPQDDGFPGTVDLRLRYHLDDLNQLTLTHEAVALEGSSVASFTSHGFFNLDGVHGVGIQDHHLSVRAAQLLEADADNVATGQLMALDGHALDLRQPRRLGVFPCYTTQAVDHAYALRTSTEEPVSAPTLAARLESVTSGRWLEVWTTEPVLQVYTAGMLGSGPVPDIGKGDVPHRPHMAICLEPQQYPNAPNCPGFPLPRVAPGQPQRGLTRYRFGLLD